MQITPVNYYSYSNKQQKIQNFEGLWGKTTRKTDYDEAMGIPKIQEVYYYYPYMDESSEQIQKQIDNNTNAYIDEQNGNSRYQIKECKVCTTLPFKEAHFRNYSEMTKADRLTPNIKRVHYSVRDKYINNVYGNEQKSAINDVVTQKLLNLTA